MGSSEGSLGGAARLSCSAPGVDRTRMALHAAVLCGASGHELLSRAGLHALARVTSGSEQSVAGATLLFAGLRARFVWWPLHPAGYAVSSSWGLNVFWSCLFASWLIKWTTLRFYGLQAHAQVGRFFMGVILGEGAARSVWGLASVATGIPLGTGHW